MDYEKIKLTPVCDNEGPSSPAKKEAKEQLKRERAKTQKFKQQYFEYYDDVKINHREDW